MSGLPIPTLPDFEAMVLDRLELCNNEIAGLNKVFRQPPSFALDTGTFPCAYTLIGTMPGSIPAPEQQAGAITVTRDYVIRVLGDPVPSTLDNTATAGAQGLIDITPFFNRYRAYFLGHPKLQTTTLTGLRYMHGQLAYLDEGIKTAPAPGGVEHFCIDVILTISMRAQLNTLA